LSGAWITTASLLAWLQITDFGGVNGLTTAVSTALGKDRLVVTSPRQSGCSAGTSRDSPHVCLTSTFPPWAR